jgi:hypothetical protein
MSEKGILGHVRGACVGFPQNFFRQRRSKSLGGYSNRRSTHGGAEHERQ